MANTKAMDTGKRQKRNERMAKSERLTNGFMLALTYGLVGIVLLEVARRHYIIGIDSWSFASKFCVVLGVVFAIATAVTVILGCLKKISWGRSKTHTPLFAISSVLSFFLAYYEIRIPVANMIRSSYTMEEQMLKDFSAEGWGHMNFLVNVNCARDAQYIEYGVIVAIVAAFVIYAIRLAVNENRR